MTIHITWWMGLLIAWIAGVCIACVTDQAAGWASGIHALFFSSAWTIFILLSAVIYLGFIR